MPKFVIQEKESWRDLIFEVGILSEIDWTKIDISEITKRTLADKESKEQELTLGLSKEEKELLQETGRLEINEAFLARQIAEIVPNPWICYNLGDDAIKLLSKKYDRETIAASFVFIIEELKKILEKQKNILAEKIFRKLLTQKKLHCFLISGKGGFTLPNRITAKGNKQLIDNSNKAVQKSLFDGNVEEEFDTELEKSVAIYLNGQKQLLWWYRNRVRKDFHVQGWRKNKIWPDFVTVKESKTKKMITIKSLL